MFQTKGRCLNIFNCAHCLSSGNISVIDFCRSGVAITMPVSFSRHATDTQQKRRETDRQRQQRATHTYNKIASYTHKIAKQFVHGGTNDAHRRYLNDGKRLVIHTHTHFCFNMDAKMSAWALCELPFYRIKRQAGRWANDVTWRASKALLNEKALFNGNGPAGAGERSSSMARRHARKSVSFCSAFVRMQARAFMSMLCGSGITRRCQRHTNAHARTLAHADDNANNHLGGNYNTRTAHAHARTFA